MAKSNKPAKKIETKPVEQPKKENPIYEEPGEITKDGVKEIDPSPDNPLNENSSRAISYERWETAQRAERDIHDNDLRNTAQHYAETYKKYFKYVGLGTDLQGLHIMEVGPAYHPALAICSNWGMAIIVEPMSSPQLFETVRLFNISILDEPLEYYPGIINWRTAAKEHSDKPVEIWIFNVMQHVIDPDKFIEVCKSLADRIRFFEPIDTPVEQHHPHSYTYQDYINYFGGVCKIYKGGSEQNFHTADCMYGVWTRE